MEYYKLTIKDRQGKTLQEEYTLSNREAHFLKGFLSTDNKTVEITTLNTESQPTEQK